VTHNPENRARLLEHALRLFAAHGYDAIGVQEICQAAAVTKPTLYHYFGSKRGLLEALVQGRSAPFLATLSAETTYTGDLPAALSRLAQAYFDFAAREPALYRMLLALWFAAPDNEAFQVVVALHRRQQELVEGLFLAATADHGNMRGRQRMYAATLLGTLNTCVGMSLNGYLDLSPALAEQVVRQFSHGIYS